MQHTKTPIGGTWLLIITALLTACSKQQEVRPSLPVPNVLSFKNLERGHIRQVLPDSSEVILNAKTAIQYQDGKVNMNGHAYFIVHKNSTNFQLQYDQTTIRGRDVEFSFNTYYYKKDKDPKREIYVGARLCVIRGTLEVSNSEDTIQYKAGDAVELFRFSASTQHPWDREEELGWLEGRYNIQMIQITDLARLIGMQYNVRTRCSYPATLILAATVHLDLTQPASYLTDSTTFKDLVKVRKLKDADGTYYYFTDLSEL